MTVQITFLPMSDTDLDWVVAAEAELHAFPWTRGNFVDSLAAGYACRVMLGGDEPLGYAVLLLVLDEAHLLNISILRRHQRQGMALAMLEHLYVSACAAGATQMFLEVRPSNAAALALYRREGFQAIGRRARYYPAADGGREDAIVMRRAL